MTPPRPFSWSLTALFAGAVNAAINAPFGWVMVEEGTLLGTWSAPGVALDLAITAFAIAFATTLIVTPQTRNQIATAKMLAPELSAAWHTRFASWPRSTLQRAINLGVLTQLLFVPLPLILLWAFGADGLDRSGVIWLKGSFAFVVGAVVTPVIAAAASVHAPAAPAT